MSYNGYINYETWAVSLWLDNDRSTYEYWSERAFELKKDSKNPDVLLADEIKENLSETNPQIEPNMFTDLLCHALANIDYFELARGFLNE